MGIIAVSGVVLLLNEDKDEIKSADDENETKTASVHNNEGKNKVETVKMEATPKLKELIEKQFDYFDAIVNSEYFYALRNAQPDDSIFEQPPDEWLTADVRKDFDQMANEMEVMLPPSMDVNDNLTQDILRIIHNIRDGFGYNDSGNIYEVYNVLHGLHVGFNGYKHVERENGRKRLDPEGDWTRTFGGTE